MNYLDTWNSTFAPPLSEAAAAVARAAAKGTVKNFPELQSTLQTYLSRLRQGESLARTAPDAEATLVIEGKLSQSLSGVLESIQAGIAA